MTKNEIKKAIRIGYNSVQTKAVSLNVWYQKNNVKGVKESCPKFQQFAIKALREFNSLKKQNLPSSEYQKEFSQLVEKVSNGKI